jgi:hypothetical protein
MKKIISVLLLTVMLISAFSSMLTVSAETETILTTDKATYTQGEPILITAKSENSTGKDWVGITVKGDESGAAIYWDYLTDVTENFNISKATHKGKNRNDYYNLPAGEYTILIIPNDLTIKNGYSQALAMVDITIVEAENTTEAPVVPTMLTTDKSVYTEGEKVLVTASNANKNGTDWVGIIPKGETDKAAIYWAYLTSIGENYDISLGKAGKNMEAYYSLPAGEYTVFIIENDQTLKKGYATAPITLDITIVAAVEETTAETTVAPDTTEPDASTPTGDSFVLFASIALLSVIGVAFVAKRREN